MTAGGSTLDLQALLSSFYERLILRDLFGKIVPGSILLSWTALAFISYDSLTTNLSNLNLFLMLLLLGFAWLAAFALQAMGEGLRLLTNVPEDESREEFFKRMAAFAAKVGPTERMHAERLLVIEEAWGNGGMALLAGVAANGFVKITSFLRPAGSEPASFEALFPYPWVPIAVLSVVAGLFLLNWHHEHVQRHKEYVDRNLGLTATSTE